MLIKIFTKNKNDKIELNEKELKELLDEAYWEGYNSKNYSWTYRSPTISPYYYTTTADSITISCADTTTATATNQTGSIHSK